MNNILAYLNIKSPFFRGKNWDDLRVLVKKKKKSVLGKTKISLNGK